MRKTSVYLDDELARRLARPRREEGRSQAEIVRDAIARYEPEPAQDREFALAAGFEADRRRSEGDLGDPEDELLEGFGA